MSDHRLFVTVTFWANVDAPDRAQAEAIIREAVQQGLGARVRRVVVDVVAVPKEPNTEGQS